MSSTHKYFLFGMPDLEERLFALPFLDPVLAGIESAVPDAAPGRGLQVEFGGVLCPQGVHSLWGTQARTPAIIMKREGWGVAGTHWGYCLGISSSARVMGLFTLSVCT